MIGQSTRRARQPDVGLARPGPQKLSRPPLKLDERSEPPQGPGTPPVAKPEPWYSPLRSRPFRLLCSAATVSNTGVWMESVMAGFVMAKMTNVPSLVAALPLATALPGVIFALPAGAVADATDRREVLLTAKTLFFAAMLGLATVTALGGLTPFALLVFSAALGTVATFSSPAWWATIGDLVPERLLSRALSLDGLQWNIGQIVGPVVGGVLLSVLGAGGMFAVASVLTTGIVWFLLLWRGRQRSRLSTPGEGAAERVAGAVGGAIRYLANAPALQVTCWRTVLFVFPAGALSALLPLFASRDLGLGARDYGFLLAAIGAGSVAGAVALPRLKDRLHLDGMLVLATTASAVSVLVLVLVHETPLDAIALAGAGASWLSGVTTLNLAARQAVPAWVVSRALGAYLMVFQASIVLGSLVWGGIADAVGVKWTLVAAAATFAPGLLAVRWLGLPVIGRGDMKVVPRPQPEVAAGPEPEDGPVMVLVDYNVSPENQDEFIEVMEELRVARRRTGASRWGLFEDASHPGHFVESFVTPSWGGYLAQRGRYTAADLRALDASVALHQGPSGPTARYFVHPESALAYRRRARWRRLRGVDRLLSTHPTRDGP
ncbi:MAG TPA: MFS transporter [Acidimicrobiales bacterium]|nr:MFS transporter [Acidimicrobiales bacterium]